MRPSTYQVDFDVPDPTGLGATGKSYLDVSDPREVEEAYARWLELGANWRMPNRAQFVCKAFYKDRPALIYEHTEAGSGESNDLTGFLAACEQVE